MTGKSKNPTASAKTSLRIALVALFAFVLALGLSACGKKEEAAPVPTDEPVETVAAEASVDQIVIKDLAFDVTDYGEDHDNAHYYRYLYTLTGTLENIGSQDLVEVGVEAGYTEVTEDSYGDPVRTEQTLYLVGNAASYGVSDNVFHGVKAHESRPFIYRIGSDNVMEDPTMVASYVKTTLEDGDMYLADESDIEVTFSKNGDHYLASIKNNTDKLFEEVQIWTCALDDYGAPTNNGFYVSYLRPHSELLCCYNNIYYVENEGFEVIGIYCADDTENPAVPLEDEFGWEPTTDEDGNPAFIIENKTGRYLETVNVEVSYSDSDGVLGSDSITMHSLAPNAKDICSVGYGDHKDVKVMNITYDIDEEKEASVAES